MVNSFINEKGVVDLARGIPECSVSTPTIKIGEYESLPGKTLYVIPDDIKRAFRLMVELSTVEGPSIDIDREVNEIPIVIVQYEDGYTAYPLDIDGVVSEGDSVSEALDNVREAISLHLEAFGIDVLPPKSDRSIKVFLAKTGLSKQDTENAENAT